VTAPLRDERVLIIGSGVSFHNVRTLRADDPETVTPAAPARGGGPRPAQIPKSASVLGSVQSVFWLGGTGARSSEALASVHRSGNAQMKKILCATDFSLRSELAVDRAAALARRFGAELVLLHAVDDDQPRPMVDRRCDDAREALVARVANVREWGQLDATVEVRVGTAFVAILEAARTSNAELIVMGAHRRRLLRDVVAGTTIERVLRTGGHPVLMVNTATLVDYQSVLVALDASEASARALRVAKSLGMLDGMRVSVVHAFEPIYKGMMSWTGVREDSVAKYSAAWAREASTELYRFLESNGLADTVRNLELEDGLPFPSIKRVVERSRPHLLVIGTRGHSGVKRLLLGSVAERVLNEIECDILAVPPMSQGDG